MEREEGGGPRKDGWTISVNESVQDDGRHGTKSKCVAREDKGRPIATWRRPLGEEVRRNIQVLGLMGNVMPIPKCNMILQTVMLISS